MQIRFDPPNDAAAWRSAPDAVGGVDDVGTTAIPVQLLEWPAEFKHNRLHGSVAGFFIAVLRAERYAEPGIDQPHADAYGVAGCVWTSVAESE